MKGYRDCTLKVNLSSKSIFKKKLNRNYIDMYIGGEGYGAALLWNETPYNIHAFSPGNLIVFNTGPLTGTPVPSTSGTTVTFISPLTNTFEASNLCSLFGAELKSAGYDSIIIEGMADNPVYLYIDNDIVEIRDARHLWGKNTRQTTEAIKKETDSGFKVACIGQAGEKLSRLACIFGGDCFSKRGGAGAVMGYKRLKAIVVRRSSSIEIAGRERFFGQIWECYTCQTGYHNNVYRKDENIGKLEYETISALGPECGVNSFENIFQAAYYTAAYGMDSISAGAAVSAAMEWYEKGIITDSDTDGLKLNFGNGKAMVELIRKMGLREGAGETFADGLYYAALKIGKNTMDYIMDIKKVELLSANLRGSTAMALYTYKKDICHMKPYKTAIDAFGYVFSDLGIEGPNALFNKEESKEWLEALEEYFVAANLLGICDYNIISAKLSPTKLADLYSSVTGIETTKYELFKKAERVITLEKSIDNKRGIRKRNDHLSAGLYIEDILEKL